MKIRTLTVTAAVAAGIVLTGCSNSDPEPAPTTESATDNTIAAADVQTASDAVVGMNVDEATAQLEAAGVILRVITLDGEPQAVTMDFRSDRINVSVENSIVVSIDNIG